LLIAPRPRRRYVRNMRKILREPLFRLLLVNLAIGLAAAALLFGGLLLVNPYGLRGLILSDQSPATALIVLLFGFCITFGSAAMGTAIMALGRDRGAKPGRRRSAPVASAEPVLVRAGAQARPPRA
jgi:hypothetical protein